MVNKNLIQKIRIIEEELKRASSYLDGVMILFGEIKETLTEKNVQGEQKNVND